MTTVALELRSGSYTLPTLRLFDGEVDIIQQQLKEKIDQSPSFFVNSPVVLDLQEFKQTELDFTALAKVIADLKMHLIGVRGGSPELHALAAKSDLAILTVGAARVPEITSIEEKSDAPNNNTEANNDAQESGQADVVLFTSETISTPIRSGQRRYTRHGDLIALAQVSEGAELMADGNIHIYGTLRGRALAGVQGDTSARIYCQNLQAELVAIAGHYQVSEDMDDELRNQPVQIYLTDQNLVIEKL
ncbi:MAG: septum site-determining protein MinC [Methylococcales bacterium]